MMNGMAKLFIHYDAIKRADEIAGHSKHWVDVLCQHMVGGRRQNGESIGRHPAPQ
jgi:hypothetical protein